MLRCLVIDDESMARKLLQENIVQVPFLELVGTCKNAFEAMQTLQEQKIDLLFLDIQMPGMLGTKFLETLTNKPLVIFVTAYSSYAVESYDLEVVDYLMKPVSIERFMKAVNKAHDRYLKNQPVQIIREEETPDYFFINVEYSLLKIVVRDITHVEGLKDYVKIYLTSQAKPVITKSTMKAFENKLSSKHFMRVHKSFIVALDKIDSIRNQRIAIGKHDIPISPTSIDELLHNINYSK